MGFEEQRDPVLTFKASNPGAFSTGRQPRRMVPAYGPPNNSGIAQSVARRVHTPEVGGSSPPPATIHIKERPHV